MNIKMAAFVPLALPLHTHHSAFSTSFLSSTSNFRASSPGVKPVALKISMERLKQDNEKRQESQAPAEKVQKNLKKEKFAAVGWTLQNETLNGRLAMIGFIAAIVVEQINPNHPTVVQQVLSYLGFLLPPPVIALFQSL